MIKLHNGVLADLDGNSTPVNCFLEIFTIDVVSELANIIHEYASYKVQLNNPPTKCSRYNNWTPVSRYEILKFIAVLIAMGLNKRPKVSDYWSINEIYHTEWFGSIFSRNRF